MCIICASPKGAAQPTASDIRTMFNRNPHGAGYMVARNNRVEIHKGFLDLNDFLRQLDAEHFTADDVVVYHFRISTQAGIAPGMTHPFPLTSSLALCEKLDLACSCGVAHNGVIRMTTERNSKYSDTALFITRYMTQIIKRPSDLKNAALLEILETLTNSKMVILDRTGELAYVGAFVHGEKGLLYSNYTYQPGEARPLPPRPIDKYLPWEV